MLPDYLEPFATITEQEVRALCQATPSTLIDEVFTATRDVLSCLTEATYQIFLWDVIDRHHRWWLNDPSRVSTNMGRWPQIEHTQKLVDEVLASLSDPIVTPSQAEQCVTTLLEWAQTHLSREKRTHRTSDTHNMAGFIAAVRRSVTGASITPAGAPRDHARLERMMDIIATCARCAGYLPQTTGGIVDGKLSDAGFNRSRAVLALTRWTRRAIQGAAPVVIDSSWRTDTVVSLVKLIYRNSTYHDLPILADALQDAGCDNEEVLINLRDTHRVRTRADGVLTSILGIS